MNQGLRESVDRAELLLEVACTWGAGHLLVTGADRQDSRDLVDRVLGRIDALGAVHVRACHREPDTALDGLFEFPDQDGPFPTTRRERRQTLVRLVEKARTLKRSLFVVVDDGDDATIAQLERLRADVDVTPEAIGSLRLVLLGGSALVHKLEDRTARALRSSIAARIRTGVGTAAAERGRRSRIDPAPERSLAMATGASVALIAYGLAHVAFPPGSRQQAPASAPVSTVAYVRTGLRGDEPFLGNDLRIPLHPKWVTGSGLFPPPAIATVRVPIAAGTSIAALVARFR